VIIRQQFPAKDQISCDTGKYKCVIAGGKDCPTGELALYNGPTFAHNLPSLL
jgi:hypothetical protein